MGKRYRPSYPSYHHINSYHTILQDLSLLTSLTHEQIQELQSVERGSHFILKDDLSRVWESVKKLADKKGGRIDFILDNVSFLPRVVDPTLMYDG